jgi:C4-dicarboxylate-specific signal transduction histidine kinase
LLETRERLSRAMQLATVAELSASVAHEINQPLAAIVANSQACQHWLATDPPNFERLSLSIERIVRDTKAAADIVVRIRALFRKAEPVKATLDLNEVVLEALRLISEEARRRNIKVETNLTSALPNVFADRVQVQQLVINLVSNALDAMLADTTRSHTLSVSSSLIEGKTIALNVRDSGPGLVDVEKVFEPFYTTKKQGMGMGLAICRSIAEQHGGSLYVRRSDSNGTIFTFTLPVAAPVQLQSK